jgi:hypothetical protein
MRLALRPKELLDADRLLSTEALPSGGNRKAIKHFTRAGLKFTLRNALCDWLSFSTLTYPNSFPSDGRVCKKHLNLLLTHLRADDPGIKYVWFMEFQARGAPHFHLFTTCALPVVPTLVPSGSAS